MGCVTHNAFELSNALWVTQPATTIITGEKWPLPSSSAITYYIFHSNIKLNIQYTSPLVQLII